MEGRGVGELFSQTFLYLDTHCSLEFLALKFVYNTGMNILSSSLYRDNETET